MAARDAASLARSVMGAGRTAVFVGHYGSGKTSIAVDFARALRRSGAAVSVGDIDIVNPYFRTADARGILSAEGIRLVAGDFAGSNVDLPSLPAALDAALAGGDGYCVLDVGGDDRGAVALGRYAPLLEGCPVLFVVNFYRPLTGTPDEALAVLHEVEAASGLRCTALINNSNLGRETTAEDIRASIPLAERLCGLSGLPLAFTAVDVRHADAVGAETTVLPLQLRDLMTRLERASGRD